MSLYSQVNCIFFFDLDILFFRNILRKAFYGIAREFRGPILNKTSTIYFLPGRTCPILNINIKYDQDTKSGEC